MKQRKKEGKSSSLSPEVKAARLQEIMQRAARRQQEDENAAMEDPNFRLKDPISRADNEEEKDLLDKIQQTYEKYLEKKRQKEVAPRVTKTFKAEQDIKDLQQGSITWKYVRYEDLAMLDLTQESTKTTCLFVSNLILMICSLFVLLGVFAITVIVTYASDEVEQLTEADGIDVSILQHNMFQFLTLMPTILLVLQILINLFLVLLDAHDEVFFYMRENGQGISMLKGIFGLALLLLTAMLAYKLKVDGRPSEQHSLQEEPRSVQDYAEEIQFKHILSCTLCCLHALSMLLLGQNKLKDAEMIYMRYLYDKHRSNLPKGAVNPKNVIDSSESEHSLPSDTPDREVEFI